MHKRNGTKMGKNLKFDKLDEWIKAEYDRETEKIEDSLSNDGSFDPDKIDSEELFQRIQSRIREKVEQEIKSEVQGKRKVITRQRVGKCAAFLCTAVIGVFLASMTSEANRSYFMYKMQYLVGNEVVVDEGNEEDGKDIIEWKKAGEIRQDIEDKLGILVPDFQYMLELRTDEAYNIQYGDSIAAIEYQYDNIIVNLRMFNRNRTDISGIDFQGKGIKELSLMNDTVKMTVSEIKGLEDKQATLAAQWEYKEGYYQLSGKVEKEEFLKILKSIVY